jgi:hypothetical protein
MKRGELPDGADLQLGQWVPLGLDEVDTTPGEELAHNSKVGGYPRFIQGAEEGKRLRCRQCRARLRFAAQFSPDLFGGSLFGDTGNLYLYVCQKGNGFLRCVTPRH